MGCLEEDMEGLNLPMEEIKHLVTSDQLDYIQEIMPLNDRHILIDRIDEIGNSMPPKAIDADKEISDLITPLKEGIEPIYLEAPQLINGLICYRI